MLQKWTSAWNALWNNTLLKTAQFPIKDEHSYRLILFSLFHIAQSTMLQNKQITINVQVMFFYLTKTCSIWYLKGLKEHKAGR